jgi:hypothetical protein
MRAVHHTCHRYGQAFASAALICVIGIIGIFWCKKLPANPESRKAHLSLPYPVADSDRYIAIAEDQLGEVESPFSKRTLYPWMAETLSRLAHISLPRSFLELNTAFFFFLGFTLTVIAVKLGGNPWFIVLCFLTPLPVEALQAAYLPDLCHMFFLALFFLLLLFDWEFLALAVMLTAFLVRENTLLLCVATGILAWLNGRKTLAFGSFIVLVAGSMAGGIFARVGLPNSHLWPEWLYLAVRVPHDFLANVMGIVIETNVHLVHKPQWTWTIPPPWRIGRDQEAYLTLDWTWPCRTFVVLLSWFGCGPLIVWWARKKAKLFQDWNLTVQIAFGYGLVCYLLGTSLGYSTTRLIGYGWPLFWIWLPSILSSLNIEFTSARIILLAVCSLCVAWLPNVEGLRDSIGRFSGWLLLIPVFYAVTWALLTKPELTTAGDDAGLLQAERQSLSGPKRE